MSDEGLLRIILLAWVAGGVACWRARWKARQGLTADSPAAARRKASLLSGLAFGYTFAPYAVGAGMVMVIPVPAALALWACVIGMLHGEWDEALAARDPAASLVVCSAVAAWLSHRRLAARLRRLPWYGKNVGKPPAPTPAAPGEGKPSN